MVSLAESYSHAERITRAAARNFFYAFRFLPAVRRRSIYAIYAFSRRCDDAVDDVEETGADPEEARAALAYLRSLLDAQPPEDPLVPALRDTMERFGVSREPLDELIAGMEMDLVKKRYATFDELYEYCYRAASVVGLVCIEIFGHSDAPGGRIRDYAEKLGIAMQLTNILRDVKEDASRGRIYLPGEDMERFAYTSDDLHREVIDERFRALMRFEVERAECYFRESEPLFDLVAPESRYCPVLLGRFYRRILRTIEKRGFDVFARRPRLSWYEKIGLATTLWVEARTARWRRSGTRVPPRPPPSSPALSR